MMNRQWQFAQPPETDKPLSQCFKLGESALPECREGEFVVRNRCFSIEPAMVPWMHSVTDYMVPQNVGEPMLSWASGEVVESSHSDYPVGERVSGTFGWQDYCRSNGVDLNGDFVQKIPQDVSWEASMSALWISGLTAFIGLYEVGRPKLGDTVLVSGAAGSVGNLVGQFAKLAGCRVVGIAGSDDKCNWLCDSLGFDAAINYKTQDLQPSIAAACPQGVDIYWDNVGGEMLDVAAGSMAIGGRIVLCGFISIYSDFSKIPPMNSWLAIAGMRATMTGFNVTYHKDQYADALQRISGLIAQGKLVLEHDVLDGFERLPEALERIYAGANTGKQLVRALN